MISPIESWHYQEPHMGTSNVDSWHHQKSQELLSFINGTNRNPGDYVSMLFEMYATKVESWREVQVLYVIIDKILTKHLIYMVIKYFNELLFDFVVKFNVSVQNDKTVLLFSLT